MYNTISITVDAFSIVICLVLLYGTIFETASMDGRRRALAAVIIFNALSAAAHMISIIYTNDASNPVHIICGLLTDSGAFLGSALMLHYYSIVVSEKGVDVQKPVRFIKRFLIICFAVLSVFILSGTAYKYADSIVITGISFYLYVILAGAAYIMFIIFIISLRKKIGRNETVVFISYLAFPIAANIVQLANNRVKLYIGAVTASLVLVYVIFQSRIYITTEEQNSRYFSSIGSVYNTMHILNFERNSFSELNSSLNVRNYLDAHRDLQLQQLIWGVMRELVCEAHRNAMIAFTDFSTLESRMKGKTVIQTDMINNDGIWYRFSFIRVNEETDGLKSAIFTSQNIDESKRTETELILLLNTDDLTHLNNRHAFDTLLSEITKDGIGDDLWYVNIDLNGLKDLNDTKGHVAGDEMLVDFARILSGSFKGNASTFRIGGDEFVVILRGDRTAVETGLEKLQKGCEEHRGIYINEITYSKGVICSSEIPGCTMFDLEKESDRRMYMEKKLYHMLPANDRRKRLL